jgi:uncharacterized membrane protein YccF (DUF307 family)
MVYGLWFMVYGLWLTVDGLKVTNLKFGFRIQGIGLGLRVEE